MKPMQIPVKHASVPDVTGASRIVLLRLLEDRGIDVDTLCQGTDLNAQHLSDLNYRMPIDEFEQLLEQSLRLSSSPDLLLRYGQEISLATLGVLGYAFMCCANLQELLDLLIRYHRLVSPECDIRYNTEEEHVRIVLHKGLLGRNVGSLDSEIFFSACTTVLQNLFADSDLDLRAEFSHTPPQYEQAYGQIFGPDVNFGCSKNSLCFSADLLEQPLQFANPVMKQIYQQQCDALLTDLDRGRYSYKVQHMLLEKPGQFPASKKPQSA